MCAPVGCYFYSIALYVFAISRLKMHTKPVDHFWKNNYFLSTHWRRHVLLYI